MPIPEGFPYATSAFQSSACFRGLLNAAMKHPLKVKNKEESYLSSIKAKTDKKTRKIAVLLFRLIHWLRMHISRKYKTKFNRAVHLLERLFVETITNMNENPDGDDPFLSFIPPDYQNALLAHVKQWKESNEERGKACKKIQSQWQHYLLTHPKGPDGTRVSLREREIRLVGLMQRVNHLIKKETEQSTALRAANATLTFHKQTHADLVDYQRIILDPSSGITAFFNTITSSPRKSTLESKFQKNPDLRNFAITPDNISAHVATMRTKQTDSQEKVTRLTESLQETRQRRTQLSEEWKTLWASTQKLVPPNLRDPDYRPIILNLAQQFAERDWDPLISPMVEALATHGNVSFAFIMGALFEGIGPDALKSWTCDEEGSFTLELQEKRSIRYWVESLGRQGEQDFAGGMVLFVGERKTGKIQGKITPDMLTFTKGFSAQVRTPKDFQHLARRDFICADIVDISAHGKGGEDEVTLNLTRYVGSIGTDIEKRKTPRNMRYHWGHGELLDPDASASEYLANKC